MEESNFTATLGNVMFWAHTIPIFLHTSATNSIVTEEHPSEATCFLTLCRRRPQTHGAHGTGNLWYVDGETQNPTRRMRSD